MLPVSLGVPHLYEEPALVAEELRIDEYDAIELRLRNADVHTYSSIGSKMFCIAW